MDQFIVSARKYRPDTFDSVVGQSHVTETLRNAIKSNHLAQAFLFSGPRGVGKTTCARILAKTINCFNRSEEMEACNECESCKSFNEGHSLNVYELDAASNNGVDDIRKLIEQVRFAPQIGTKKVYIIDEVHMLSASAFNAFLKTLEEPPPHAIFILATTEKHKIIPTVLSRCQIFDFSRIDNNDMVRSLEKIAEKEGVSAENDALHLIAQKSDGSLRDALSMFDQMVTYSGNNLTYVSVVDNLSILGTDYFFDATDFLVSGDTSGVLLLLDGILKKGFDGHNFITGLAEHFRNLLVTQDHRTIDLLNVGPNIKEKYREQTQKVSAPFILKSLNLLNKADLNYKSSKNQRLLVEICLINLANLSLKSQDSSQVPKRIPTANEEGKKKQIEDKTSLKTENSQEVQTEIKTPVEKTKEENTSELKEERMNASSAPVREKNPEPVVAEEGEAPETSSASQSQMEKTKVEKIEESKNPQIKKELEKVIQKKEVSEVQEDSPKPMENNSEPEMDQKESSAQNIKERAFAKPEDTKAEQKKQAPALGDPEFIADSLSISAFTSEEESKESGQTDEKEREIRFREAVNESSLAESWKRLKKMYQEEGRINLFATLNSYEAKLIDENHIVVTYDNKSQAEAIRREKMNILDFMRQDLKNDLLQLKLKLSDKPYQKAFTDSEKLQKMIEKNPNIDLLKNKLDLDIN